MTVNAHGVDLEVYANMHKDAYGFKPRGGDADSITMDDFERVQAASGAAIAALPAQQAEWTEHASTVMKRAVTYEELCKIVETNGEGFDDALDLLVSYPC